MRGGRQRAVRIMKALPVLPAGEPWATMRVAPTLVVLRDGSHKDDRGDPLKRVDPLAALIALPSHVHHAELHLNAAASARGRW